LNLLDLHKHNKVNEVYEGLTSKDWLYSKTPDFTNNLEKRFDWGIIDAFLSVVDGKIVDGKVYSDSLYPDFIDSMNKLIQSKQFDYDEKGIIELCSALRDIHKTNENLVNYTKDLQKWLLESI